MAYVITNLSKTSNSTRIADPKRKNVTIKYKDNVTK